MSYVPNHPLAHLLDPPGWDVPGRCICGGQLPAQRLWDRAGSDWQNIACRWCRRLYVDEEEYLAISEWEELVHDGYSTDLTWAPRRVRDLPRIIWRWIRVSAPESEDR